MNNQNTPEDAVFFKLMTELGGGSSKQPKIEMVNHSVTFDYKKVKFRLVWLNYSNKRHLLLQDGQVLVELTDFRCDSKNGAKEIYFNKATDYSQYLYDIDISTRIGEETLHYVFQDVTNVKIGENEQKTL